MAGLNICGLAEFSSTLERVISRAPELRAELHEELAQLLKDEVDGAISGTVADREGRIKDWQEQRVGSKGGYAAISPARSPSGKNGAGAITNYLESGHVIRRPGGGAHRYKPRIKTVFVSGRHFYSAARGRIEPRAIALIEEFANKLVEELEG